MEVEQFLTEDEKLQIFNLWRRVDVYNAERRVGPSIGMLTQISQIYKIARQRADNATISF